MPELTRLTGAEVATFRGIVDGAVGVAVFATKATLESATVPADVDAVMLHGYAAAGDGGGARYKRVRSEPAHAGKIQDAGDAWWEIAEREIHIRMLGAKEDGETDDATALLNAHGIGRPLRFGPGVVRLASMVEITDYPPIWRGAGRDIARAGGGAAPSTLVTTLFGDHDEAAVIKIKTDNQWASDGWLIEDVMIRGKIASPPNNQHGIIMASKWNSSHLHRVSFRWLTGYGFAVDPTSNAYGQNASWRDISFYNVGGCLGLTEEPADGQGFLACTLLKLDNINLDIGINTTSPQPIIWDFRAFRELSVDTFLNEGTGAAGTDVMMAFANDAHNSFNNLHVEFSTNPPTYLAYFYGNPDGKFFGHSDSTTYIRGLFANGKFGFDALVESELHVEDWSYYFATGWDDLLEFNGHGGFAVIERLQTKKPFSLPEWIRGQAEIVSARSDDNYLPHSERGPTLLAKWRPDVAVGDFGSPFLSLATSNVASEAIEADPDNSRLKVLRLTQTDGSAPQFEATVHIPPEWFNTYDSGQTVGPVCTLAVRWRADLHEDDSDINLSLVQPTSTLQLTKYVVDFSALGKNGEWQTGLSTFRMWGASGTTAVQISSRATQDVVVRIAAADLYLGRHWAEPLDLSYAA